MHLVGFIIRKVATLVKRPPDTIGHSFTELANSSDIIHGHYSRTCPPSSWNMAPLNWTKFGQYRRVSLQNAYRVLIVHLYYLYGKLTTANWYRLGRMNKYFLRFCCITERGKNPYPQNACCFILRCPGEEGIVDVVPRGTELELKLRRGFGQAAHTLKYPQVKCTGVY